MTHKNEEGCLKPADLVRTEAAALDALAARLEGPMAADFDRAVELIVRCGESNGRVVVTGMGKEQASLRRKIAATLSSIEDRRPCFCIQLKRCMGTWGY